jgi:hypothetical protein
MGLSSLAYMNMLVYHPGIFIHRGLVLHSQQARRKLLDGRFLVPSMVSIMAQCSPNK